MHRLLRSAVVLLLVSFSAHAKLNWQGWSPEAFAKAKAENRLVVLDLEAIWCHWCHVMEEKTYSHPEIAKILEEKFILLRVDQDSRPDLSQRYADYGWPATIFFNGEGKELAKRAGFVPPEKFLALIKKLVANPVPEEAIASEKPTVPQSPFLTAELKKKMRAAHLKQYDKTNGGWGRIHKFIFGPSEELALTDARNGDKQAAKMMATTLEQAKKIIDPVWGGAYQYSVEDWDEPHFEKIAFTQTKFLQVYSQAAIQSKNSAYVKSAEDIRRFLKAFLLSPEKAFYTSMDADLVKGTHSEDFFALDDKARRAKGIPSIDKNLYARENGWYAQGLLSLYAATADEETLQMAKDAVNWALKNRLRQDGGFNHAPTDAAGPYLGDSLEMGTALLNLYETTGERKWIAPARDAANFISRTFSVEVDGKGFGYKTAASAVVPGQLPDYDRMENIRLVRFSNRLFHYLGDETFKKMAEQGMRYLVQPKLATELPTAGTLLADEEMIRPPLHLTVVGAKADPNAKALFRAGLSYPGQYRRIEWWDKSEGDLPRKDVTYPQLNKAALFVCTEGRCSLPMFDAASVHARIDDLLKAKPASLDLARKK